MAKSRTNNNIVDFPNKKNKERKRKTKKRRKRVDLINLLLFVFILTMLPNIMKQYKNIHNLDSLYETRSEELEKLEVKAKSLAKQAEKIDDENVMLEVVERIARDDYKMVRPNEIIYIDSNKVKNKFITGIGTNKELINSENIDKTENNDEE